MLHSYVLGEEIGAGEEGVCCGVSACMSHLDPPLPPSPSFPQMVAVEIQAKVGEKVAICRCWKSSKFPLCDGAHNAHNKACGDAVGPAIVTVVEPTA